VKKTILLSYLALLLALGLPFLRAEGASAASAPEAADPPGAIVSAVPPETSPAPTPAAAPGETSPVPAPAAATESLAVLTPEGVVRMEAEEYLVGVVAAEMPASFPAEALKAQAVAARTYALYCAQTDKHGEAAVCTDPGCCQAWQSEAQLRDKWGADFEERRAQIRAAVEATAGQYLSWEGRPIFAAFHASSAGATEDSGALWRALPYLVSVSSPETAAEVPNYVSTVQCLPLDLRDTLLSARPEADFTGAPEDWLGPVERDGSGRVSAVTLGGAVFSGAELRALFRLRSTAFELGYADGVFTFTVTGSGHGVGMSQYGAKALAEGGADYAEILAHYYPGTALEG